MDEILLCTDKEPSILSLSWSGQVNEAGTCSLSDIPDLVSPDRLCLKLIIAFTHMSTNKIMDLFCFVNAAGDCYLAQRKVLDASYDTSKAWAWSLLCFYKSEALPEKRATVVSINSALLQLAVGTHCGDVHLFSLSEERTSLKFTHTLQLPQPPGLNNCFLVGAVSSLEFSSDGYALAVGWFFGGLSVWSVAGRLLFSTMSEDTLSESPTERPLLPMEDYFNGVRQLV